MKTLTIYPTFLCPFACNFCFNKDKLSFNEYLSLDTLEKFMSNYGSKFDEIIISGGEPSNYSKAYFDLMVDIIKNVNENITVNCYPYSLSNYRDDVHYNFSYDFLVRVRANDAWENMLRMPKKFNISMLLTPMLMKSYHPNVIFKKLALQPMLNKVELLPYYKSKSTTWNLTNNYIDNYMKAWLSSSLNVPFINVNKEKMRFLADKPSKIIVEENLNYNLLPNGTLNIDYFDEQDVHSYKEITIEEMENNYKCDFIHDYDLYNNNLLVWFKNNDL